MRAHTHKFLVYLYLSIYAHFLTAFHVLTWKKMGFLKAVQPRPPAIHRPLPPAGAQPPWVSPRTMPGAVSPRTMPGAVSPRMAVPPPRTASPRMGRGKCIVSISFNRKIHEFPLHQFPFFSYSSETRLPSAWGAQMPGQMPPQMPSQLQQMYVRGSGWCMLSWVDREESETSEPLVG